MRHQESPSVEVLHLFRWSTHTHTHLLCKRQYNCGDTDLSHRHLLYKHQYNCGDTDHSHWHLLCKRQYSCGETDHSHGHLLCKHQYNCGDTDHSHRHLLCKRQYNYGATTQLDTLSGPLQTHSPLWRALRPSRRRLPTVADGCERLPTVADGCERKHKTWRTQPHPQTPKWNGNPRYAFGKNIFTVVHFWMKQNRLVKQIWDQSNTRWVVWKKTGPRYKRSPIEGPKSYMALRPQLLGSPWHLRASSTTMSSKTVQLFMEFYG